MSSYKISEELEKLRMPHNYCEDGFYSCPHAEDGCGNELAGDACDCGADEHNSRLDKIIERLNRNSNG